MTSYLEEQLTRTLEQAAEETPVPHEPPVGAVRALQRRRGRRRVGIAAAAAVAAATVAVLTGTHLAAPAPQPEHMFSADRIPDFTELPGPQRVWPAAVHRLPGVLPDGSRYSVTAVLDDDRYLVTRNVNGGEVAPSIFDTRTGALTALGVPALSDGLVSSRILMAREAGGKAVWFLEGTRDNRHVREAWAAPLDGGPASRLATLPDGSDPRFSPAGNAIIWGQQTPLSRKPLDFVVSVRSVSVNGGPVRDVNGTRGFEPAWVGPWITDQRIATAVEPRTSGELRNVVTGERLPWKAAPEVRFVQCGPTWCTGLGTGDRIALQSLNGHDRIELPVRGELSPTGNGRLAVGRLELATGAVQVVWDRTTGRAATFSAAVSGPMVSGLETALPGHSSDFAPEVLTMASSDDELVVLDLGAIAGGG
jgi:hypothetical protein